MVLPTLKLPYMAVKIYKFITTNGTKSTFFVEDFEEF